jgi:hypothetical protein
VISESEGEEGIISEGACLFPQGSVRESFFVSAAHNCILFLLIKSRFRRIFPELLSSLSTLSLSP